ncbi:MAG: glycosyltransferase family 2 protein [Lachnospiraceae bacterium]|nr:glycosyltransferase family 2 protein [Lachnospiraceae bacterium]
MQTLALVMIVKNEERSLARCLSQAVGLTDKIYITDTGSTDKTKEIAVSYGAVVTDFEWNHDFSAARNFALSQSDCDWNLMLDADEYLVQGTRKDIEEFLTHTDRLGAIERKDYYMEDTTDGRKQEAYSYSYTTRLLPRGVGYVGRIHEQVDSKLPIYPLPLLFEHDGYLQEGKAERNLAILLEEVKRFPEDPYILYQAGETLRGLKRYGEACKYYADFYRLVPERGAGYRANGIINYLYALIEVQDWARALTVVEAEKKRLESYADFHFACGILFMKAILADTGKYVSYLPRIEQSYLKCLEIGEVPENQGVGGTGSFRAAYNLGTWYEVAGNLSKAVEYYRQSAEYKYQPAEERLKILQNKK